MLMSAPRAASDSAPRTSPTPSRPKGRRARPKRRRIACDPSARQRPKETRKSLTPDEAARLIQGAVSPKAAQHRLGHSQISMTMNTYAHALDAGEIAAAEAMDRILGQKNT